MRYWSYIKKMYDTEKLKESMKCIKTLYKNGHLTPECIYELLGLYIDQEIGLLDEDLCKKTGEDKGRSYPYSTVGAADFQYGIDDDGFDYELEHLEFTVPWVNENPDIVDKNGKPIDWSRYKSKFDKAKVVLHKKWESEC